MEVRQIAANHILSPTRIPLGDYVINPYKGCFFDCTYCYERKSRRQGKETRNWGQYVDARINAVLKLEREILTYKPKRVLIGSTCDCFQPAEKRFGLTTKIIRVLNSHKVHYTVFTRSPLIADYTDEFDQQLCERIMFTVNSLPKNAARLIEPHSANTEERFCAINKLKESGLKVITAFAPFMPGISQTEEVFRYIPRGGHIRIEGLNFNVGNIDALIRAVQTINTETGKSYSRMKTDKDYYTRVWRKVKTDLKIQAENFGIKVSIDLHRLHQHTIEKKQKTPVQQAPCRPATETGQNYELF